MNLSKRMELSLTPESLALIRIVKTEAEHLNLPLYIIGGSVRDLLLGSVIKDFDLTVEGDAAKLAESILRKFGGKMLFHSRFGTATWTLDETTSKRLGIPNFQVANFPPFLDLISARSETYSEPGALPTIKKSTIDDDLRRRDFTINAMAIRLDGEYFGELYDPLDGQDDLQKKLIRVLHPKSFIDDPTRIFRAVRYAERYGFKVEPETSNYINDEARAVLSRLSGERLRHEIDLIFEEKNSMSMIVHLESLGILRLVHRELQYHNYKSSLDYHPTDELPNFVIPDILSFHQTLAWIMWLIPLSVSTIETIASKLAFPSALTVSAIAASKIHLVPYPPGSTVSQKTFYLDMFPTLASYAVWVVEENETVRQVLSNYLLKWRNIKPITTGDDLKAHGLEPGPKFKEILTRLRAAWLDGEVGTEEKEKKLLQNILMNNQ
jgi:tRNA nucleotidyltransferase (CCA-adding enzyme)